MPSALTGQERTTGFSLPPLLDTKGTKTHGTRWGNRNSGHPVVDFDSMVASDHYR